VEKPIIEFAKHPTGKHGVNTTCKSCRNEYRKQYYIANREKNLMESAVWAKNNAYRKRASTANRRALVLKATPKWANKEVINNLYKEADSISKFANYQFEVDHIIPLQGKNVCGLHVENNLQIISMVQNRQKAVRYES
jgi:hypothetical protein